MSKPYPTAPPNPYHKVEVPYVPEPTDDPDYDPHGAAPDPYAIAFAVREVAEQMKKENGK
jgi:hypothetical protein